ncbi:MAG: hypothetical protein JXD19_11735 [Deltaproteobacteria bacterium]|nr:hypothetical protein [Deltaproteobacteria bacterium]
MEILYKVTTKDDISMSVPKDSKYCLQYKKGERVKALTGTLGILLFKNLYYAKDYMDIFPGKLKRVRPLGPVRVLTAMATDFSEESLDEFYAGTDPLQAFLPPLGTVVCDEIEVLD